MDGYHANNGIFRDNKWIAECARQRQRLTFSGVNAHHKNDISERIVRSLSEISRAMIIHEKKDGRVKYLQIYGHMLSRWQNKP